LILFAALLAAPASADGSKLLELKPKWKSGDIVRYEMTRTYSRDTDGKPGRKVTVRTPVEVEVIATDDEGTLLRWTQGSTVFDDPKQDDDPLVRAISGIQKGLDIDLELNADGVLIGLRNWKELRGTGLKVQDAVLAQMAKTGTTKNTIESLRKETEKLFASKESLTAAFIPHAALLLLPYGREYELGKTVPYETTIPNVFGGDEPFPAKGTYTLKSISKDATTAILVFKQTLDPKEANSVLRQWLEDVAKKTSKPAPKELPELQVEDALEYEFDLVNGWLKSVTHTCTAKMGTNSQSETVTLKRKPQ
jgi:hypothetical protein